MHMTTIVWRILTIIRIEGAGINEKLSETEDYNLISEQFLPKL